VPKVERGSSLPFPVWRPISRAQAEDGGPLLAIGEVEIDPQAQKILIKNSFVGRAAFDRLPRWLQEKAAAIGARPGDVVELSYDYETDHASVAMPRPEGSP
jgi:hypothetical protein